MSVKVVVPRLHHGEKVRDWRKLFVCATAHLLNDVWRLRYLEIGVRRNMEELALAKTASNLPNLEAALDYLELHIDEKERLLTTPQWTANTYQLCVLSSFLDDELLKNGEWTDACTSEMSLRPLTIFEFDKVRQSIRDLFNFDKGVPSLLINPMYAFCTHSKCVADKNCFIKLHWANKLDRFKVHLQTHTDEYSRLLLEGLQTNTATTLPSGTLNWGIAPDTVKKRFAKLYVTRDINPGYHYLAHWLNALIVSCCYTFAKLISKEKFI